VIATAQLTAADLAALPDDGNRYELLRGDLLTMPPTGLDHGMVFGETFWQFKRFARETDAGIVVSEVGFLLARDPPTVLAPDVAFIRRDRVPAAADRRGFAELAPDLVVEVVSPSNSMSEIHDKVLTFLETGVHAVLVLEPKRRPSPSIPRTGWREPWSSARSSTASTCCPVSRFRRRPVRLRSVAVNRKRSNPYGLRRRRLVRLRNR
jgi:Uma2 family endonuclease